MTRAIGNVLVTGAAGFIGSNFVRHLLAVDPAARVVSLDALTYAGSLENLRGLPDASRHRFVHGDVCDGPLVERLLRDEGIATIVHFAAETHVDRSIAGPGPFVRTNVGGTFALLDAARQAWLVDRAVDPAAARLHHVSTDEVYGTLGPDDPPFREETPYAPRSPYAASKAAADHLVRSYVHTYGLPATISNCSNNYGPYQFPEKLIPVMVLGALEGKPLPVYGDGLQIRDWLFVDDHCDAIVRIVREGRAGETYNVGGATQPTNRDIVHRICAILDDLRPDSPHAPHARLVRHVADRPGHDRRYAIDARKIDGELGWRPRETLESGLRRTIEWYVASADWIDRVRRRPGYDEWMTANYAARGSHA